MPEGEEREKDGKKYVFEEITKENITYIGKELPTQVQEV